MSEKKLLPIIADVHMHSNHSHALASVEAMFTASRAKGLTIIGFSEHSPRPQGFSYPHDYQEHLIDSFNDYIKEVKTLALADNGVEVLLGLELDYIPSQEEYARSLLAEYDYDYVIGGLHFQFAWGFDCCASDWEKLSEDERFSCYEKYYIDMIKMCETGLFNIVAHPDLVKIFSKESFDVWLENKGALALIETALLAMKKNRVAMEISSAGLRKPCKEIYPGPKIMEIARDTGVMVTFASDAHCTNTPAYAFDELARYASHYDFQESVVFIKKEPRFLPFTAPVTL